MLVAAAGRIPLVAAARRRRYGSYSNSSIFTPVGPRHLDSTILPQGVAVCRLSIATIQPVTPKRP
jgi:hypothetical protein